MIARVHAVAGALALLLICTFWASTAVSEAMLDAAAVRWVKLTIPWGFLLLIPAMAAAGASGFRLAARRRGPVVAAKMRRMKVIAANGILVLMPCALWLAWSVSDGTPDPAFAPVQALELAAGALNITLLALNLRDGIRLARRRPA